MKTIDPGLIDKIESILLKKDSITCEFLNNDFLF